MRTILLEFGRKPQDKAGCKFWQLPGGGKEKQNPGLLQYAMAVSKQSCDGKRVRVELWKKGKRAQGARESTLQLLALYLKEKERKQDGGGETYSFLS